MLAVSGYSDKCVTDFDKTIHINSDLDWYEFQVACLLKSTSHCTSEIRFSVFDEFIAKGEAALKFSFLNVTSSF